ncbi:adenylate/guanylate cyclase domain-containing protein [Bermanella marisrubri]|uniref:Adenylate cyclase, family 3 n=1 Tax=Bermanella marisrubri TaxID=207949 RepID=Q1N335_9GAMM|nr:adenylate/guanylate cyclase domain-containing protein [Bermanella marisrubri]EAT12756.1 Adenylate cyclase, family 3 [Oceanobacter sp. RED65] [Bermanella marisrubri]QIZ85128.1 adenylate/guanylate cyclase domain-containing protein [Bermanella marisrubri]
MAFKKYMQAHSTRIFAVLLTLLISWLAVTSDNHANLMQRIEYLLYDLRFNTLLPFTQREASNTSIVIVDIDERSLIEQGRFPWSRHKVATLVDNLGEAGAIVIAFDVVFSEQQVNPVDEMSRVLAQNMRQEMPSLDAIYEEVDADIALAESLKRYDTVLGFFFQDNEAYRNGLLPLPIHELDPEWKEKLVVTQRPGYTANVDILQKAASGGGFVTMFPDFDGIVRRSPLVIRYRDHLYPSLALSAAMRYLFIEDIKPEVAELGDVLTMTNLAVSEHPAPTDPRGFVTVPYQGRAFSYPYISATDVLNGKLEKGLLSDSIILVGTSAIGLADLRSTPMGPQYPGVEVHANILDALLNGGFPYKPDWSAGAVLFQLVVIAIFMIVVLPKLGAMSMLLSGIAIVSATFFFNGFVWIQGFDLPLAAALLLTVSLTALFIADGFIRESVSKRVLKSMFDQYVPPAHIEKMLADPDAYSFAGEHKLMTVLFSDIRSFTSISEKLSARELKLLLNTYFTPITKEIFDHQGTIDKYVGDMVMAFWGAPLDDENHRENAIKAALRMQQVTEQLKPMFIAQGLPEVNIGIGINTGFMNVGDMGSSFRRAYTVLGDAVNLGSRLESITKFYGVKILVGEETHDAVDGFVFRFVDRIVVKGKETAIRVYEPLGSNGDVSQDVLEEIAEYNSAYQQYVHQDWIGAKKAFAALQLAHPKVLYDVYLQRIDQLSKQTLPQDWDGTFIHTSK